MGIFVIGDLHLSLDEKVNKSMDIFGGILSPEISRGD